MCEVYSDPEYAGDWAQGDAKNYLKRFYDFDPTGCFVAKVNEQVNEQVVGAIFSYSYPWQKENLVYVQEVFVIPEQRQKGIAKALLKVIGQKKNTKLWLVAKENTTASAFYGKIGLKKDTLYKINYGTVS